VAPDTELIGCRFSVDLLQEGVNLVSILLLKVSGGQYSLFTPFLLYGTNSVFSSPVCNRSFELPVRGCWWEKIFSLLETKFRSKWMNLCYPVGGKKVIRERRYLGTNCFAVTPTRPDPCAVNVL
jgi:hypothetical protein